VRKTAGITRRRAFPARSTLRHNPGRSGPSRTGASEAFS